MPLTSEVYSSLSFGIRQRSFFDLPVQLGSHGKSGVEAVINVRCLDPENLAVGK